MKAALVVLLLAGCSSIVDAPCKAGYTMMPTGCVARTELPDGGVTTDAGDAPASSVPDARSGDAGGSDAMADAGATPDAAVCSLDLQRDPDNCGFCGHVCASGLCSAGHCSGEPYGHIVAIGHDFAHYHASMARVLGNAVALGAGANVAVAWWPAGEHAQVGTALGSAMGALGRPWHAVAAAPALTGVDVLVVDGATSASDGSAWQPALDPFLARGGVVVVIEGADRTGHLFAAGAHLFTSGEPVDVTGQALVLAAPTDTVADQVLAPYLGEATTVSFPGLADPVVATPGGGAVVVHRVR